MALRTLQPGQDFVVFEPVLFWAPRFTPLVGPKVPPVRLGGIIPPPWLQIMDTVNGIAPAHRNPVVPVNSEERDRIGSVRGENAGSAITFRALTMTNDFWKFADSMTSIAIAARPEIQVLSLSGTTVGAAGNALITLPGLAPVSVPLAAGDTPAAAAGKIAAAAYAGYTAQQGTGANASVVTFTASTAGPKSGNAAVAVPAGLSGSFQQNQVGIQGFNSSFVDTNVEHSIMVMFEGITYAGELFPVDTIVRGFGYRCENTQNGQDIMRRVGRDSVLSPNVALECLPEQLQDSQLQGTGFQRSDFGSLTPKFNYFDWPIGA